MPNRDIDDLAKSLKRAKEIFAEKDPPGCPGTSPATAFGYLEMAVERFLDGRKRKKGGKEA